MCITNTILHFTLLLLIRFRTPTYRTDWQKVEKGIITGCTLSVVLFSLAMTYYVQRSDTQGTQSL